MSCEDADQGKPYQRGQDAKLYWTRLALYRDQVLSCFPTVLLLSRKKITQITQGLEHGFEGTSNS